MSTGKNKSGVYVRNNVVYVQGAIDGRFYRKSTGKKATKVNLTWARKNAHDVLYNLVCETKEVTDLTVLQYGRRCLEDHEPNVSTNTYKDYMMAFEQHIVPHFGKWQISDILPQDIKSWQAKLSKKGIGAKRIKNIRIVLSRIFNDAVLNGHIEKNPLLLVPNIKAKRVEICPLDLDEVQLVIRKAEGWFRNYLIIAFFTGLRTGELLGLKWSDVSYENQCISVERAISKGVVGKPKTQSSIRNVDMLPVVQDALKEQYLLTGQHNSFVFLAQHRNHYKTADSISKKRWKPLLKKCGLQDRRLYETRHTFASLMLQQGEELVWVSTMMGHADVNVTLKRYVKYIKRPDYKRAEFVERLDLESA